MAIDWMTKAARVIHLQFDLSNIAPHDTSVPRISAIISEHCPFKPDVAYMSVPRCDQCKHWMPMGLTSFRTVGKCIRLMSVYDPAQPIALHPQNNLCELRTNADFGCVQWEAK